jgi:hypothetical protein
MSLAPAFFAEVGAGIIPIYRLGDDLERGRLRLKHLIGFRRDRREAVFLFALKDQEVRFCYGSFWHKADVAG